MHKLIYAPLIAAAFLMTFTAAPAVAEHSEDVIITPIGSHDGLFCRRDRALVFEDPNHTRILYDAGRTVRRSGDSRLGLIQVVLLSSVHSDHLGEVIREGGACSNPRKGVSTTPDSNTGEIAANVLNGVGEGTTGAQVYVGGQMASFLAAKIADADTGDTDAKTNTLRPGGSVVVGTDGKRVPDDNEGVEIAVIPAFHSNGIDKAFLTGRLLTNPQGLTSDGLTAYAGPDHGYILTFTNGLVVYMTGDTGIAADMALVVRDFYGPHVVVINLGDGPSLGPKEAAFAVKKLLGTNNDGTGVATVIPEHANEASIPGTLGAMVTEFISRLGDSPAYGGDVIVPFSTVDGDFVITCDGAGACTQTTP